jgi:DNA-3-methyladenine glycosylase
MILPKSFYVRSSLKVAPDLLGKEVVRQTSFGRVGGLITEVEAYKGHQDPASHAFRGITPRNEVMFGEGGVAYVYFIYGMYFCLNVVTGTSGIAEAVLIRGLIPATGKKLLFERIPAEKVDSCMAGPGKLCNVLEIDKHLNGKSFCGPNIAIHDQGIKVPKKEIATTPRIGTKAGTEKLWRFVWEEN